MTLLLPITTFRSFNLKYEDRLIESYTDKYGRSPDEQSTVREWFDCMMIHDCLWFVRHALMPRFPDQKELFDTVCRQVAFICTESILPLWDTVHPKDQLLRYTFNTAKRFLEQPNDTDKETLCCLRSRAEAAFDGTGRVFWSADLIRYIVQSVVNDDNDFAKYAHSVTTRAYGFYHDQWQKDKTDRIEIEDAIESARKRLDQLLTDLESVTQ
jgi:hypothetical protein